MPEKPLQFFDRLVKEQNAKDKAFRNPRPAPARNPDAVAAKTLKTLTGKKLQPGNLVKTELGKATADAQARKPLRGELKDLRDSALFIAQKDAVTGERIDPFVPQSDLHSFIPDPAKVARVEKLMATPEGQAKIRKEVEAFRARRIGPEAAPIRAKAKAVEDSTISMLNRVEQNSPEGWKLQSEADAEVKHMLGRGDWKAQIYNFADKAEEGTRKALEPILKPAMQGWAASTPFGMAGNSPFTKSFMKDVRMEDPNIIDTLVGMGGTAPAQYVTLFPRLLADAAVMTDPNVKSDELRQNAARGFALAIPDAIDNVGFIAEGLKGFKGLKNLVRRVPSEAPSLEPRARFIPQEAAGYDPGVAPNLLESPRLQREVPKPAEPAPKPLKPAPAEAPVRKKPWQMTLAEYLSFDPPSKAELQQGLKAEKLAKKLEELGHNLDSTGAIIPASGLQKLAKQAGISNIYDYMGPASTGIHVNQLPGGMVGIKRRGTMASMRHESAVYQALSEGKQVPAEVLADYPDLQPKAASVRETPKILPDQPAPVKGNPIPLSDQAPVEPPKPPAAPPVERPARPVEPVPSPVSDATSAAKVIQDQQRIERGLEPLATGGRSAKDWAAVGVQKLREKGEQGVYDMIVGAAGSKRP